MKRVTVSNSISKIAFIEQEYLKEANTSKDKWPLLSSKKRAISEGLRIALDILDPLHRHNLWTKWQ